MWPFRRPAGRQPGGAYERRGIPPGDEWIEHLRGVPWFQARKPPRRHSCWPQTRAFFNCEVVERCPCGGIRFDKRGSWADRHSRR